ncbi:NAD(P)/FAD-dependent oxidoreductase [Bosea sp. 117]|uniref:NAD(P)/FAD-dependent oxidoreductase n=1 Tax=Bosea sp. 117 TaxID=1125973 RepID=UPI000AD637C9|nr:NAD(P)/FAD-dependent oxidoreductase [Bosea sp. 117]
MSQRIADVDVDVVVIGAGAAGMMCAIEAGRRRRSVLVLDRAQAPGEKIRISGGGRCNFTNHGASPKNYLSNNPAFCISALKRYTQHDFIRLVEAHGIAWHEKTLGQLFCDGSARQIIDMLLAEMRNAGAELRLGASVDGVEKTEDGFRLRVGAEAISCRSLVVASGGKSIPKMGATGFGYDLAQQFGLAIVPTRPALVPLTLEAATLERLRPLAGVSVDASVHHGKIRFDEAMLFTHRGLSGPAILQISSYWREGDEIALDIARGVDVFGELRRARAANGRQSLATALAALLPKRLAQLVAEEAKAAGNLADLSDKRLDAVAATVKDWRIRPVGSEGYRTAEVTLGGVDTAGLDSRTMQAKAVPGLYFIGEVVDITGWLGGYNFQWAWSSGWCAGQYA